MFEVFLKWCREWLSKLSKGTFYPHIFKKIQAYDKQQPLTVPVAIIAVLCLVALVVTRVVLKPVAIKGCTWILSSTEDEGAFKQRRPVAVEAQTVHLGTMTRRIQTVGKLTANASVTIRSEIHGRIKKVAFKEGSQVKQGDLLIQFEDDDIQAELKQAEAELALRKADYSRAVQLQQNKAGTMKDYDKAHAELAVSEGRAAAARSKLAKTTITAPFEGTIGLIHFSEGSYIQANQELVHLVDTTPMKVDFKVPEKFVNDIGSGQMAEVRVQALGDRVFMANVDAVDSKVDTENHSIAVKGSIDNENGWLKAGSFAQVSLIIGEKGDTIVVDEAAVDREGNFEFVWVIEKGRAHRQRVITGVREKNQTEIVAGLQPGQIVVTAGQIRLADGMNVNITNMTPEAVADAGKSPTGKKKEEKTEEAKPEEKKDKDESQPADKSVEIPKVEESKPQETKKPEEKVEKIEKEPETKKDEPQTSNPENASQQPSPETAQQGKAS